MTGSVLSFLSRDRDEGTFFGEPNLSRSFFHITQLLVLGNAQLGVKTVSVLIQCKGSGEFRTASCKNTSPEYLHPK